MTNTPARYTVVVRHRGPCQLCPLPDTATWIESGQIIGFSLDERSHVIAFTRLHQYDLGPMPPNVKYICWTRPTYRPSAVERSQIIDALVDAAIEMVAEAVVEAAFDAAADAIIPNRSKSHRRQDPPYRQHFATCNR